jgi:hypothetical protein
MKPCQMIARWLINLDGTPAYLVNCAGGGNLGFPHKSDFL